METPALQIRGEIPSDKAGVFAVHAAAFPTHAEAQLVDRLRALGEAKLALVAESANAVVGHVLFSPVSLVTAENNVIGRGLGLAPLAVLPDFQSRGIGSLLVREGLAKCREMQASFVVVLGGPGYYTRFGFVPAMQWNIANEYGAGDEFMIAVSDRAAMPVQPVVAKYGAAFAEFA